MKAWCATRTALSSDLQKKINDSQPFSCCHVASMMHSYQALGPACAFMTFDRTAGLGSSLRSLLLSLCACVCLLAVVALGLCLSVVCVVLCFLGAFCVGPWSSQGVREVKQKKAALWFFSFHATQYYCQSRPSCGATRQGVFVREVCRSAQPSGNALDICRNDCFRHIQGVDPGCCCRLCA